MRAAYIYIVMTYAENLLGALALSITDRLERVAAELAPPGGQLVEAMVMIAMRDGISVKRLAQRLRLSHPGAVRMIDRLEEAGWAERTPGSDGRTLRVVLTDAGKMAVAQFCSVRAQHLRGVLKVLTPAERQALETISEKLLRALTIDLVTAYANCRMCDTKMCEASGCPVEAEARAHFTTIPQAETGGR